MMRKLVGKIVVGLCTLFAVYTVTFLMVVVVPGNPFEAGDRNMSPEVVRALEARYHMDDGVDLRHVGCSSRSQPRSLRTHTL